MSDLGTYLADNWAILVLVGMFVAVAAIYRYDHIKGRIRRGQYDIEFEGKNAATEHAQQQEGAQSPNITMHTVEMGKRGVAIGGSAEGANIITGDSNKVG